MTDPAFLSREYNNRALVPEHPRHFARWDEASRQARATVPCYLDQRYGNMPGETLDIFRAPRAGGPALVFIHGGYWRSLDKKDFSFLAPAWVDAGVSLVVVNYGLCPNITIEEIVRQMLRASRWLWRRVGDYGIDHERLYVSGHSAGGHLVAMLLAALWPVYARDLPAELYKGGLAISGIYDLRPLVAVDWLNGDLRLDEESALKLSPAFLPPATRAPLYTCAGGAESSEFLRQNALLGEEWKSVLAADLPMPDANHFTVLDGLCDTDSALHQGARRMMRLA